MRGPGAALLPPVADGQLHLRREPDRVLAEAAVHPHGPAVASRIPGHDCRGHHHLCAVQAVLTFEAGEVHRGRRGGSLVYPLAL